VKLECLRSGEDSPVSFSFLAHQVISWNMNSGLFSSGFRSLKDLVLFLSTIGVRKSYRKGEICGRKKMILESFSFDGRLRACLVTLLFPGTISDHK